MTQDDENNSEAPPPHNGSIKAEWDNGAGTLNTTENAPLPAFFASDEFDIFVNKISLQSYIFHGKPIEQDIAYLEYDAETYTITVVKNDGTHQDLGARAEWLVRSYFSRASEVSMVQTKDGESISSFIVPLKHKNQQKT